MFLGAVEYEYNFMRPILSCLVLNLVVFPIELLACQTPSSPNTAERQSPLQTISANRPQRSPFSTAELTALRAATQQLATSWVDLAGLAKLNYPPTPSTELQVFRKAWLPQNPAVVPFLGTWYDDGSVGVLHSLSIFPAIAPNRVCILEYADEVRAAPEDILSPKVLAVYSGTVVNQQLLSSRLRTHQSAILPRPLDAGGSAELMGADLGDGRSWVFAATTPPAFPIDFPTEAIEATEKVLTAQGCTPMKRT